jgi:16S rRNA (guanine527-N7)-methyltransferase
LHEQATEYGIKLSQKQLELLNLYLEELIEWNSRMNLTGIVERERMIFELFLDSLIPVSYLPSQGRMLDVGSGAGFPAVVIKVLMPDLKLQMVEANFKKVSFLKQVIRLLKLDDIEAINGRIELLRDKLSPDGYEIISARALANLNQIISWCAPLLVHKGLLLYFSGSQVDENLKNCEHLMMGNNLTVDRLVPYHLPGMKESRNIVILRKEMSG